MENTQSSTKNDTPNKKSEKNNRVFIKGIMKQKKKYEELYNLITVLGIDGHEVEANILAHKRNDNDGYDLVKQLNEVIKNDKGIFEELKRKKKVAMEIKGTIKRPSFEENDINLTRNRLYQSLCNDIRNKTLTSKDLIKYLAAIKNVHFSAKLKKAKSSQYTYDKDKDRNKDRNKDEGYLQGELTRKSRHTNVVRNTSTSRSGTSGAHRKENLTDDISEFIKKQGNASKTYNTSRSTMSKTTESRRSKNTSSYRQSKETSKSQMEKEEEKEKKGIVEEEEEEEEEGQYNEHKYNWQNEQCEPNELYEEYADPNGNAIYMLMDRSHTTGSTVNITRGRAEQKQQTEKNLFENIKMFEKNAKYLSDETAKEYKKRLQNMILEHKRINGKLQNKDVEDFQYEHYLKIMKEFNKKLQEFSEALDFKINSDKENSSLKYEILPYSKQMDSFIFKQETQQNSFTINESSNKLPKYKGSKALGKGSRDFQEPNGHCQNEEIPNEKISDEKISNEKISDEKISNEKISNEKIPKEKIPKEKIPKEKIPKEKIPKGKNMKYLKFKRQPILKLIPPSRNTKWSPIVKKTIIYKAKPKMYTYYERPKSDLSSQRIDDLTEKYYKNQQGGKTLDVNTSLTKSKDESSTIRSYSHKMKRNNVSSRGTFEISRPSTDMPVNYVVKETDSTNNAFPGDFDISSNSLRTFEKMFYKNNIDSMFMINRELMKKNEMMRKYIEKANRNSNVRSKSNSTEKSFIWSTSAARDIENNNNFYQYNTVSPNDGIENFLVNSLENGPVPSFKKHSSDISKYKQYERPYTTEINSMLKIPSRKSDHSNSELKPQKMRTSEILLLRQKQLSEVSDKGSRKLENGLSRGFSKRMFIKQTSENQQPVNDIYNTTDDINLHPLPSDLDVHLMTNKSNLPIKETEEMIEKKTSQSLLSSNTKVGANKSYENYITNGNVPIKKNSSKTSQSQTHNKKSLFNTTIKSLSGSTKNVEQRKGRDLKRKVSYGVISNEKSFSGNLSNDSENTVKQKNENSSILKTCALSKQKKHDEEEELKIGKKITKRKNLMKSKNSLKPRKTTEAIGASEGFLKSENSCISKQNKEHHGRTMSKEKKHFEKQLQKSSVVAKKDADSKEHKSALFIKQKSGERSTIDKYRKSKSMLNLKQQHTFSNSQSTNNILKKLNSEPSHDRLHSVTETPNKTIKRNKNIHEKNTNEINTESSKIRQPDETDSTQNDMKYSRKEGNVNTTDTQDTTNQASDTSIATTTSDTQKSVRKNESNKAKKKGIRKKGNMSPAKRNLKRKDDNTLLETKDGCVKKGKKKNILEKATTPQSKKKSGNAKDKNTEEADKRISKKGNGKQSNKKKTSGTAKKTLKTPSKASKLSTSPNSSDGENFDETKKNIQKGALKKLSTSKNKKKRGKSIASRKELSVISKNKEMQEHDADAKQNMKTKERTPKLAQPLEDQNSQSEMKTDTSTDVENTPKIQRQKSDVIERNHIKHSGTFSDKYQIKESIQEHKNNLLKKSVVSVKDKSFSKSDSKTFKMSNSRHDATFGTGYFKKSDSKSYVKSRSQSASSVDSKLHDISDKETTNLKEKHTVKTNNFNLKKGGDLGGAGHVAEPDSDSSNDSEYIKRNKRRNSKIKWTDCSSNSETEKTGGDKKRGSSELLLTKMSSIKNIHSQLGNRPIHDGDQETSKMNSIVKAAKESWKSSNTQNSIEIKKSQWTMKDITPLKNKLTLKKKGSSEVPSLKEENKDVASSTNKEESPYSVKHIPKSFKSAFKLSAADLSANDKTKYSTKRSTDAKDTFKLNKIKSDSLETPESVLNQPKTLSEKHTSEINVGNIPQAATSKSKADTELYGDGKSVGQKYVPSKAKSSLIKNLLKKTVSTAECKEKREQAKNDEEKSSKSSLDLTNEIDDEYETQKMVKKTSSKSFLPKNFLPKLKGMSSHRNSFQVPSQKHSFKNSTDKMNEEDKEPLEQESMSKNIVKQKPILGLAFQNKLSPIKMKPTIPPLLSKKNSFKTTPSFNKDLLKKTSMESDTNIIKKKLSNKLSQEKNNKEEED